MGSSMSSNARDHTSSNLSCAEPHSHSRVDVSRRSFIRSSMSALALPLVGGCTGLPSDPGNQEGLARLTSRPGTPTETPTIGLSELDIDGGPSGIMYVPDSYSPDTPIPLFIGMHGAGGDADNWNGSYPGRAEDRGMVFLAPDSHDYTWDMITNSRAFGPDVERLDAMLRHTFARCRIDPTRIALGGFSDGASYALSLGIGNGDLFSHLVAYSPGFYIVPDPVVGTPPVFISHGTFDTVLSFGNTRDRIVPGLRDSGHDVTFFEFAGGHEPIAEASTAALDWFFGVP